MEENREQEERQRSMSTQEYTEPLPSLSSTETVAPLPELSEAQAQEMVIAALKQKASNAGGLFFAVCVCSIVTTLLTMVHSPIVLAGLEITVIIDALVQGAVHADRIPFIALVFDLIPLAFFIGLGFLARKHWGWLVAGMVFYTIDGLLGFFFKDWMAIAFHGYFLWQMWQGVAAGRAAQNLEKIAATNGMMR